MPSDAGEGAPPSNLENEKLQSKIQKLEREIQCHQEASNRWECPEGFIIETIRVGVDIKKTGAEVPPSANLHHFVAKHVESEWESNRYIDKNGAIRCAWDRYVEMQLSEITKERDELQRRWDQRKMTEESKKRKGDEKGGKE